MYITPSQLAAALALVIVGSVLQGSIGFGLAAVVAPVLLLVDKRFLPGPMLAASMLLTLLIAWRDRRHTVWSEVAVGTCGRVAGMIPASFAMYFMSERNYELVFAAAVLAGVIISAAGWHVPLTLRNLFITAIGSGFISTISAVGGPPLALVYQHEEAAKIRGTLNAVFTIGTPISLFGLACAGKFNWADLLLGISLMPGVAIGFALSRYTTSRLDRTSLRPAILVLSAVTAIVVMIRALNTP
jgi:uncharacterized protein